MTVKLCVWSSAVLLARLLIALALAAPALTACSGIEEPAPSPPSSSQEQQPAITEAPAGFNAADIAFAFDTITRHGQSIELSALVPERSTDADVIALASEISTVQQPDLEVVKVLLVQWNENPNAPQDGSALAGMVDEATIARLEALSGSEFDILWLQSMLGLHQGAVGAADTEIADGTNVDAVATAQRIFDTQRAQIDRIEQLLATG